MLNKIVKKLLVFLLCFACAMPFLSAPVSLAYANKNYDASNPSDKIAFVGTEYKLEITGFQNKIVSLNDVVVYAKTSITEYGNPVFKDGKDVMSSDDYYLSFTTSGNVLSVTFTKTGVYNLKVQEKLESPEVVEEYNFKVENTVNNIELKYVDKTAYDTAYAKYLENINTEVNGVEGADKLKLGKSFEVPSVDDLIYTQLPYNALNKQVYYLVPGSATYSSTSALSGTPKFKVSAYGKYVYYVLLSSDNLTDNKKDAVKMTVDYLKEELDGFYQYVEEGTNKNVFYNGETKKFYASKDEAKEGEGTEIANAVKGKLIVPKFTFELENEGPVIDITSAYQENGYIGASYRVSSITVNGSESTTYTLYYKESLNATAIDVTEEENFDTTNLTFTPSKAGIYYVEVTAVDSVGTPAHGKTANIKVSSKYSTVTYKVGFADWLEKNTLPFVLLCVSGACLIAIICLLFIKPKDATAQKVLKKVDEKDADR